MKTFVARRGLLTAGTVATVSVLAIACELGRMALRPSAVYSGLLLLALVLVLTFFNVRKKLPFLPLLRASTWMQVHIYLGWISVAAFLLHTGGRVPDGRLEVLLALVFLGVAASGAFGLWISRRLPARIARSGENLVFERIPAMRRQLHLDAKALVRAAETEAESSTLGDFYTRELHRYFLYVPPLLSPLVGSDVVHHRVGRELAALLRYLDKREAEFAGRLAAILEAKRNLDFQYASQRLLKLWLFVHIPLTYGLLVLAAAHIWLALHYGARF
jgi:hypothetical protein